MRLAAALVVALAGACESGTVVVVHPTSGTQQVALFVATGHCDDCDFVFPPGADGPIDGEFFARDGASMIADVGEDGTVAFKFEPGERASFEALLAIGLGAPSDAPVRSATSAALLTDRETNLDVTGPRKIELELERVNTGTADDASRPYAAMWASPERGDLCAGYQSSDDSGADRTFVVPADNPDCDELPTGPDCDPLTHSSNPSAPPPVEEADCVRLVPTPTPQVDVCMLQGPDACSEDTCKPTDYCAPLVACNLCTSKGTGTLGCFAEPNLGGSAALACQARFALVAGHLDSCFDEPTLIRFPQLPSCDSISLARADEFPVRFEDHLDLDDAANHTLTVAFEAAPDNLGCAAKVLLKGSVADTGLRVPLLAKIASSGGPHQGVVLPMALSFEAGMEVCPQDPPPPTCQIRNATTEPALSCLRDDRG